MSRYTATTDDDLRQMLEAIGVASVQELFDRQIPADVRLGRALDLDTGDLFAWWEMWTERPGLSGEDERGLRDED